MPRLTWRETGESDSDIGQLLLYLLGTLLKQLQNVKSVVPPPILGVYMEGEMVCKSENMYIYSTEYVVYYVYTFIQMQSVVANLQKRQLDWVISLSVDKAINFSEGGVAHLLKMAHKFMAMTH